MARRSILISGAGVAGVTLGYWLAEAGDDVVIVEKSGSQRSSGNPVDVRGDAAAVVRSMGVWRRVEDASTGVERVSFIARDGRPVATLPTQSPRTRGGAGKPRNAVEIGRAELVDLLLEAAQGRVRVVQGDAVTAVHEDGSGVDVEFGRIPPQRFDLVVGADGLHSGIRRLVFGAESDFARSFGMFIATVRMPIDLEDPRRVLVRNEPGRSLAVHPAGGVPGCAFIFRSRAEWDGSLEAGKALVAQLYERDGWIAPQALAALRDSSDVYFDAVTRIVMERWHRGRVVLLGDAASCLSLLGEGSSNAIAGAKTLADALADHPGDHVAAFTAYERAHRRRIAAAARGAAFASHFLVPASAAGITARNTAARALGRLGLTP